jgi:hypothetical protein
MTERQAQKRVREQLNAIASSPERLSGLTKALKDAADQAARIADEHREQRRVDPEVMHQPFTL